jgi:SAM-dependent methyltransferase
MCRGGPGRPNWYLDPLVAEQKREVHLQWIARNVPAGSRIQTLLKTDLFEEAYGQDDLLFWLPFDADVKAAIDIDARTVAQAAYRVCGSSYRFIPADVRRLPLRDGCVDLVLSNSTLDHFDAEQKIEDALGELARVLKPGGTLLVTLDNPRNPLYRMFRPAAGRLGLSFSLGKTLPLGKLRSILERLGLEVQSSDWLIHNPRFLSTLMFLALRRTLGPAPTGRSAGCWTRFPASTAGPLAALLVRSWRRAPANRTGTSNHP